MHTNSMRQKERTSGRPKEIDEPLLRITVTIDEKTADALRKLGMGNLSLGCREAVRRLKQIQII